MTTVILFTFVRFMIVIVVRLWGLNVLHVGGEFFFLSFLPAGRSKTSLFLSIKVRVRKNVEESNRKSGRKSV